MFQVRNDQLDVLSADVFERELSTTLHELFPEHCQALGGGGVANTIRFGIAKAKQYAITRPPDVARYVGMMFAFGTEFDIQCDWASGILTGAERDGTMTVERLDDAMMTWLRDAIRDSA